jgi:hypothetical protein
MALQANHQTPDFGFDVLPHFMVLPVADNVHNFDGALIGKDSAGRARPMTAAATTAIAAGWATEEVDNTVAGHTAGGKFVRIKCGVMAFKNDASNPVTLASRYQACYAVDDEAVSSSSSGSTRAIAGVVIDVPASGDPLYGSVMVLVYPAGLSGSDATTLAGNLASGGTALGDLQKIGYTPGVATGGFCDVVCALTDLAGSAISGVRQVTITAIPATEGASNGALAAATSAVGTVLKALNPATGAHVMTMDTGATGLFSFKCTDAVNEAVVVRVEADGCRPLIKKITISGN